MNLRSDADQIMRDALAAVLPDRAVVRALETHKVTGNCRIIAIGKAAYRMAAAAHAVLRGQMTAGLVVTKHGHGGAPIKGIRQIEAGHPIPDEHSIEGAKLALEMVGGLTPEDTVVFLVSGGGSALFEEPLPGVTLHDIADVTRQLLASGADIVEINAIRKHLSAVKGGRFAEACAPARVLSIVLSDVLGDALGSIASGPAYPDASTSEDALGIARKYGVEMSDAAWAALKLETPKALDNVVSTITGNVRILCEAAADSARGLGYRPLTLTTTLNCEARDAGAFVGAIVREIRASGQPVAPPCALILGGEPIVHLRGDGLGGRNQELALSMGAALNGLENVLAFSLGSDGTDGPTDAAGGIVDGAFARRCRERSLSIDDCLARNDSHALLKAMDALLVTGPTGTNVNDLIVALVR